MEELPGDHWLWGREFDWFGIDRHGQVAVFTTAGSGPLPQTVTERAVEVDAMLESARELPAIGSASRIDAPAGGDYSDWYAYSAKGFYAYDWGLYDGPYLRVSSPTVPISVDRLPGQLQAVARLAVFPLNFAHEPWITAEHVAISGTTTPLS